MSEPSLMACPFCGGKADEGYEGDVACVGCQRCQCCFIDAAGYLDGCREQWDRRADSPAPAVSRLLAAAKEAEGTFVELYGPRSELPDDCEAAGIMDLLRAAIAEAERMLK